MKLKLAFGVLLTVGTLCMMGRTDAVAANLDPNCGCYPRRPVVRYVPPNPPPVIYARPPAPRSNLVCVNFELLKADWDACETKSLTLSTVGDRSFTKRYFTPRFTICRPRTHPNLGYRGKGTGLHYVVDFHEGRQRWAR